MTTVNVIKGQAGEELLANQWITQKEDDLWYVNPTGFFYAVAAANANTGEQLDILIDYDKRNQWHKLREYFTTHLD